MSIALQFKAAHWCGSNDKTVRIWDLDDLKVESIALDVHSDVVSSVIIQDNKVMSGSGDKTIRIWDLKNPKSEPIVLDGDYSAVVNSVAIQDNKVVPGFWDRFVRV